MGRLKPNRVRSPISKSTALPQKPFQAEPPSISLSENEKSCDYFPMLRQEFRSVGGIIFLTALAGMLTLNKTIAHEPSTESGACNSTGLASAEDESLCLCSRNHAKYETPDHHSYFPLALHKILFSPTHSYDSSFVSKQLQLTNRALSAVNLSLTPQEVGQTIVNDEKLITDFFKTGSRESIDFIKVFVKEHNRDNFLNVYVVDFYGDIGESEGKYVNFDGVKAIFITSGSTTSTMIHEVGHYFGLLDTQGTFDENSSNSIIQLLNCSNTGDRLCDTPPDLGVISTDNPHGCSPDGSNCSQVLKDNVMSYYPSSEKTFTPDQQKVILCNLLTRNNRALLNVVYAEKSTFSP